MNVKPAQNKSPINNRYYYYMFLKCSYFYEGLHFTSNFKGPSSKDSHCKHLTSSIKRHSQLQAIQNEEKKSAVLKMNEILTWTNNICA